MHKGNGVAVLQRIEMHVGDAFHYALANRLIDPRQRFVSLRFDFPSAAREEAILIGETGIDADTAKRLVAIGKSLRALKDRDLEEVASTRLLVYAATLIKAGLAPIEACRVTLVESLTDDIETTEALLEIVNATFGR